MTNEATDIDHSATGHSCAHCDASEDHHSLDEKGLVDAYRGALNAAGITRIALAAALVIAAALLAPLAILAGALSWLLATGAGILFVSLANRKYGTANAVVIGTVASAALLPVTAWATSRLLGGSLAVALGAAAGWFLITAVVETLRDRRLSALLIEDSRDAEAARQGVLFGEPISPWAGLGWTLFTAIIFGAWAWATGVLPLVVLPLIPLQVVFALLSRRTAQ